MKRVLGLLIAVFTVCTCLWGCRQNGKEMKIDYNKLAEQLASSVFADKSVQVGGKYGLKSSDVGVDRVKYEDETLYVFPDDSEFSLIIDLSAEGSGVSTDNSSSKNSAAIAGALTEAAKTEGKKKIILPSGTIEVFTPINIIGMSDIYITGSTDTVLMFGSWCTGFQVQNSDEIHIKDITVNYKYSPILSGVIKSYDKKTKTVDIEIDSNFNVSNSLYKTVCGWYEMTPDENGHYYIDQTKNQVYAESSQWTVKDKAANLVSVQYNDAFRYIPEEGTVVTLCMTVNNSSQPGVMMYESSNLYLEHFTIMANPGMGIVAMYSENLYINHLRIQQDVDRHIYYATTHDGIHTVGLKGDLKLTNSLVEGTQDDCVNVCAGYDIVKSVDGNVITISTLKYARFEPGDTVDIYDEETMALIGTYKVTEITGSKITLDSPVPASVSEGDLMGNDTKATRLTISNSVFANTNGRGALIQCRNSSVTNCSYYKIRAQVFSIHSVMDQFAEAIMPRNIELKNNKCIECMTYAHGDIPLFNIATYNAGTGATTPGSIYGITVSNNFIYSLSSYPIGLYGCGDVKITDNMFCDINNKNATQKAVSVSYTKNSEISGNYFSTYQFYTVKELISEIGNTDITVKNNYLSE